MIQYFSSDNDGSISVYKIEIIEIAKFVNSRILYKTEKYLLFEGVGTVDICYISSLPSSNKLIR